MKLRNVLLIGALAAAMCSSAVFAEEAASEAAVQEEASGGLLESLFGEGGPLNDVLPEGTDIDTMLDIAKEQLGEADSEISLVLGKINDVVQEKAGDFSPEALEAIAKDLLGQIMGNGGEDSFDFSSWDAYMEIFDSYNAAEEEFIKEHNAEMMDPADVQIVSQYPIYTSEYEPDDVEVTVLACMIQNNYRMDDENQLLFVCGGEDIVLFRHEKDEDGKYAVVDAVFAEDGENYTASIEKMCDEVGITLDECFDEIAFAEIAVAYDLEEYLKNNPDIKGIEYQGEVRTAEELDEMFYAAASELYPPEEDAAEEALTEDAGSL